MNHDWMKDEDVPEGWEQTSRTFLQPFRIADSEAFVQNVMRKVRIYDQNEERRNWTYFARWAFPVLALSFTGFAVALVLTVQPLDVSVDSLVLENWGQNVSADQLSIPTNEDQILDSVVAKP